jgi:hypothetical protein
VTPDASRWASASGLVEFFQLLFLAACEDSRVEETRVPCSDEIPETFVEYLPISSGAKDIRAEVILGKTGRTDRAEAAVGPCDAAQDFRRDLLHEVQVIRRTRVSNSRMEHDAFDLVTRANRERTQMNQQPEVMEAFGCFPWVWRMDARVMPEPGN